MVDWKGRRLGDILTFANGFVFILLINLLVSKQFYRFDLTEEKRFSVKPETLHILRGLEDEIHIEVFLEGKLNASFQRFQKAILETLEEFRIYSKNKITYSVTDPAVAMGEKARNEFMADLASKGIQPTNIIDTRDGQREEQIIFPGVVISYEGVEKGVMLLKGNKAGTPDQEINQSIEGIEYEIISVIHNLISTDRKSIGFVSGHGELDSLESFSLRSNLFEIYDVFDVNLSNERDLKKFDVLVIAKPRMAFAEPEKYVLDQFLMQGGKILFLMDKVNASMDSVGRDDYFAGPNNLNLDDQLFKYGVRINPDLVQDRRSGMYPVITGQAGGKPKMQLMEWPFFPLISQYANHPITRNLDAVLTKFCNSIDTVKATGILKTPLLMTSPYSRKISTPVHININELRKNMRDADYVTQYIPVGVLLEGKFTSLYKNRFPPKGFESSKVISDGVPSKIVVIADGDVARNDVNPRSKEPQALGFDPMTNTTFANRDLLLNTVAYLTNENGLIQARNKEVKIRPLDKVRLKNERFKWQVLNLGAPLLLLIGYGVFRFYLRKKRFAKF
ncbi:gliding motility-associated ABC transporter substrate-binding protein GldG [Chryseolinea sp. H1M3-3]|uniref:gliding motility-associated ABC transporter substrate-binding protein GldG n=1 Tax=Chryseolinea sp. H1M3-3 TaxID=3034144 RepID=UPI0023EBA9E5|nr:gliding motility-associated ABC transporter substrate-binding protein GldG [Chryseolinea sp. H1M3-3]